MGRLRKPIGRSCSAICVFVRHAALASTLNRARGPSFAPMPLSRDRGLTPSWRPRVFRLGRPLFAVSPSGLFGLVGLLVGVAVVVLALWTRPQTVQAVGVIGDSRCGRHHRFTAVKEKEPACTVNCVRLGAEYILVSGNAVYEIENQQFPGLADFAGREVAITGTVAEQTIVVSRIVAVPH